MENPNPNPETNQQEPAAAAASNADTNANAAHEQAIREKDAEIARLKEENATISQSKTALETSLAETNQKLSTTQTEFNTFKRDTLAKEIAVEAGLPAAAAARLKGSTTEELKADALELAGMLGKKPADPVTPPNPTPGANPPTPGAGGASGQPSKQSNASDNLEPRPANVRF